jgi:hypothetical protein
MGFHTLKIELRREVFELKGLISTRSVQNVGIRSPSFTFIVMVKSKCQSGYAIWLSGQTASWYNYIPVTEREVDPLYPYGLSSLRTLPPIDMLRVIILLLFS